MLWCWASMMIFVAYKSTSHRFAHQIGIKLTYEFQCMRFRLSVCLSIYLSVWWCNPFWSHFLFVVQYFSLYRLEFYSNWISPHSANTSKIFPKSMECLAWSQPITAFKKENPPYNLLLHCKYTHYVDIVSGLKVFCWLLYICICNNNKNSLNSIDCYLFIGGIVQWRIKNRKDYQIKWVPMCGNTVTLTPHGTHTHGQKTRSKTKTKTKIEKPICVGLQEDFSQTKHPESQVSNQRNPTVNVFILNLHLYIFMQNAKCFSLNTHSFRHWLFLVFSSWIEFCHCI